MTDIELLQKEILTLAEQNVAQAENVAGLSLALAETTGQLLNMYRQFTELTEMVTTLALHVSKISQEAK